MPNPFNNARVLADWNNDGGMVLCKYFSVASGPSNSFKRIRVPKSICAPSWFTWFRVSKVLSRFVTMDSCAP